MKHGRRFIATVAVIVTCASGVSAQERLRGGPSTSRPGVARPNVGVPPKQSAGTLDYLDGIEALEAADFARAAAVFTRAIQADDENADYYQARGVANVLTEQLSAATSDFERALQLRPNDRESRMWLGAARLMANDMDPRRPPNCFIYGGDLRPDYANLVCNKMARDYWASRYKGSYFDREAGRNVRAAGPIKTSFPDAARAYAARHKASPDTGGEVLLSRMKSSYERGDCPSAMKDLLSLRRASPDDLQLRAYWATCLVATGDALHARTEFTRVLTAMPFWSDGYVGRASAAAALGDERRASADLQVATALHARAVDTARQNIAALARSKPPEDAVARFAAAVNADTAWSALVEGAVAVQRWSNARRDRYDEAYQDRVRVLNEAVRDDGKNADPYEMLARFLYRHRDAPAVWNGPRSPGEQVRPQSLAERRRDLSQGLEVVNEGLKLNGRHANSFATKAQLLFSLERGGEAGRIVDDGLAIENKNVRLLRLKAESLAAAAGSFTAQASGLRAGRTETHRERLSDGREQEVTTHYPPSAAEVSRAASLEAQAAALQQQANQLAHEAQRVESEVIPALVREGESKLVGDAAGALRAFQQASAYDPDAPGLTARLAEAFKRLGDTRRYQLYTLLANPMRHTTAADALKAAWQEASRTAWRSAGEALDRAAAVDPADARTPAYRSVVAAGRGDQADAQHQRVAAVALEEARARLMGTTFAGDTGAPLALEEIGLTLILRLEQGRAFSAAHELDRAAAAFAAGAAFERRIGKDHLVDLVPSAMLPDPSIPAGRVPEAPSLASLTAWCRLESARALAAAGRTAEAKREYLAVRAYLSNWPATSRAAETMYVVDSWARLGLVELAVSVRDYDEAFRLLTGNGFPGGLPPELETKRKALTEKVFAARKNRF